MAKLTWAVVDRLAHARDTGTLAGVVLRASEAERLAFGPELESRVRAMREDDWWRDKHPAGGLALVAIGCLPTAARVAALLGRGEMRQWEDIPAARFLAIARARGLTWLGDLGVRLAGRLPRRDPWAEHWAFVDALLAESGAVPPVTEGFVRGWLRTVHDGRWAGRPTPLADCFRRSRWLDLLLPAVFALDAVADELSPPWFDGTRWISTPAFPGAVALLIAEGRLDRQPILAATVDRLVRGGRAAQLRPFAMLHDELAPTAGEMAGRAADYARLAAEAPAAVAALGQRALRILADARRLEPDIPLEWSPAVLARPERALVRAELAALTRVAERLPPGSGTRGEVLLVMAEAFRHHRLDLQELAVTSIGRLCPEVAPADRARLATAAEVLVGEPGRRAKALFAAGGEPGTRARALSAAAVPAGEPDTQPRLLAATEVPACEPDTQPLLLSATGDPAGEPDTQPRLLSATQDPAGEPDTQPRLLSATQDPAGEPPTGAGALFTAPSSADQVLDEPGARRASVAGPGASADGAAPGAFAGGAGPGAFAGGAVQRAAPMPPLIGSAAELAEEAAALFHAETSIGWERVLAGLVALHASGAALGEALPPVLRRHAGELAGRRWGRPALLGAAIRAAVGDAADPAVQRAIHDGMDPARVAFPGEVLTLRVAEVAARLAAGPMPLLLATPTRVDGSIDPGTLIDRMIRAEAEGWQPWPLDFEQALLRVDARDRTVVVPEFRTPRGRQLGAWLRAGGLPDPVSTRFEQCSRDRDGRPVSRHVVATLDPARADDAGLVVEGALVTLTRRSLPRFEIQHDYRPDLLTAVLPQHREVVAAWALPGLTGSILPLLAECSGPLGPAMTLAVAYGLAAGDHATRVAAVDAFLMLADATPASPATPTATPASPATPTATPASPATP
ncbi:hypothetical protein, partial [Actinoplanes octamycinicus]